MSDELFAETVVDAPVDAVWAVVHDPAAMSRWSPECFAVKPFGTVGAGAVTLNLNRRGVVVWPTWSRIVRFEPGRELAWSVPMSGTVWSLELAPGDAPETTALGHRRVVPRRRAPGSPLFARVFLGGVEGHDVELAAGMLRTLAAIKADVER